MNIISRLAAVLLLIVISGCAALTGPSPDKYLERNISVWNTLIADFNAWNGGTDAERMAEAMAQRKGMQDFRFNLGNARDEAARMRKEMDGVTPPEDATVLHSKLLASLDQTVVWHNAQLKLADLPDNFSDEQAEPLLLAVDKAIEKLDTLTDEVDRLQSEYAKKHHISVTVTQD